MTERNILNCWRCGSVPKVQHIGEWYKLFCPVCFMGRSKHACDDLEFVITEWNNRAKHEMNLRGLNNDKKN